MKISTSMISRHMVRFERAVENRAFKGAQAPENHEQIEQEYAKAKANLRKFMIESIISGETIDGNG